MNVSNLKIKKSDIGWAVPYMIPFLFLAMWLNWMKPELLWAEGLLAAVPVCILSWWNGRKDRKLSFGLGLFLTFYVNQLTLFWCSRQMEEAGATQFAEHFAPSTPEKVFLEWFLVLAVAQVVLFLAALRFRRIGEKKQNKQS